MVVDGIRRHSRVRQGYIIQLFRDNGCLDEFIDSHWSHGCTVDGERRMRRCEAMRGRHLELLDGDEVQDCEGHDEDDALKQSFALES